MGGAGLDLLDLRLEHVLDDPEGSACDGGIVLAQHRLGGGVLLRGRASTRLRTSRRGKVLYFLSVATGAKSQSTSTPRRI
jgi:hypothetical protein